MSPPNWVAGKGILLMLFKTHRMIGNYGMSIRKNFPTRLAVGLLIAILIDTVLQLVWKAAVLSLPSDGSPWLNVQAILHRPLFIFVVLLMPCQFFNWLMVLGKADLSFAQPITSLSYVSVFCLSVFGSSVRRTMSHRPRKARHNGSSRGGCASPGHLGAA